MPAPVVNYQHWQRSLLQNLLMIGRTYTVPSYHEFFGNIELCSLFASYCSFSHGVQANAGSPVSLETLMF